MLRALHERAAPSTNVGDLPMLLAYFVELDPSPELFADLLGRCAADPRPGVADAARVLQRAWQRGLQGAEVLPQPPLAEVLRTLGALLDAANARGAYLVVAPDAVRVQTFGDQGIVDLGATELRQEIAAHTALRGQLPPAAEPTVRHASRLRAIGLALDAEPSQTYELAVMPRAVLVEGSAGYCRVFTADDLAALLAAATRRRQTDHGAR
ncbi:MAG TPA: hypothetical protein VK066_32345 [Chloroflexota bacterium]|nr:hypothetical protein [Chloroflexota bacterium]HLI26683.1 hypothetical protein [Chloroflexota bacterium]